MTTVLIIILIIAVMLQDINFNNLIINKKLKNKKTKHIQNNKKCKCSTCKMERFFFSSSSIKSSSSY